MKVWITKYALTTGIMECAVHERNEHDDDGCVMVVAPAAPNGWALFHGNDWHKTLEAAKARAATMQHDKINSLRKQIAKLEKLTF